MDNLHLDNQEYTVDISANIASRLIFSIKLNTSMAPENEGLSLHSQKPVTGPYPEPTESTLQHHTSS
jgi:hypothetical protein